MAKRTKLKDRILPLYTRGENVFSMVANIVGASFGLIALIVCIVLSVLHHSLASGVTSAIYGVMLMFFYIMSSVYHGLGESTGRKVMQVMSHCSLYCLLAGSYTPVLLVAVRPEHPYIAWIMFLLIWAVCIAGLVYSAIDHYKYEVFTMVSYFIAGWLIILIIKPLYECMSLGGVILLFMGTICYTVGALFYIKGHTKNNMHSVYQILLLCGTIFQFAAICGFVI